MSKRFPTFVALGGFAIIGLAACNQADAPAETIDIEVPPAETVIDEVAAPDIVEPEDVTVVPEEPAPADHAESHEDEHGHEDGHDHEEGHEHEEGHDHADDHSHDHDDHGVGEAHVHGAGEMAIVLEGTSLSVSLEAPLASFASFEHEPETPEQEQELQTVRTAFMQVSAILELTPQADCNSTSQEVAFRHTGDHGSMMVDYVFDCGSADDLSSVELKMFEAYPGLETVDTIFLNGSDQVAMTLTAGDNRLSLK